MIVLKIFNLILSKLGAENTFKFSALRQEVLDLTPNFSRIGSLPNYIESKDVSVDTNFINEEVIIKQLDYYFSNSISRASKTMSECRQIKQKQNKTGTDN